MNYIEFLETKHHRAPRIGFEPGAFFLPLFPWQGGIVSRACRVGRFAIFADCGMGKTPMQLEWCMQLLARIGGSVLVLCPLAVAEQTRREGMKFGVTVTLCRSHGDLRPGINVTNYEMLGHFRPEGLTGIVLDESSILKNYSGAMRQAITEFAAGIPYRLCCTATPAPNDMMEIGTHAEFLGVMRRVEMLATYFTHDSGETQKWRLKHHAIGPFFRWMSGWCLAARSPADLGYDDRRFILPPLNIHNAVVDSKPLPGRLFAIDANTLSERREARKASIDDRASMVAAMVNADAEPWVVWCDLNRESELLAKAIPDAMELRGSGPLTAKVAALNGFTDGRHRVIVTKPSIAGYGLNWQHCARVVFVGLSDSYEQYYQAIRRCWRFGQTRPVEAHVITSRSDGAVLENIRRKEAIAEALYRSLVGNMRNTEKEADCGACA